MEAISVKQVIAIRKDKGLSKGEMLALIARASAAATQAISQERKQTHKEWIQSGQKKVVIRLGSLQELLNLERNCKITNILTKVLPSDSNNAKNNEPVVLAIGPASEAKLKTITDQFPLL